MLRRISLIITPFPAASNNSGRSASSGFIIVSLKKYVKEEEFIPSTYPSTLPILVLCCWIKSAFSILGSFTTSSFANANETWALSVVLAITSMRPYRSS